MNILVLTYHYPPEKSVGGERPFSLKRNGHASGHKIHIVTDSVFGSVKGEAGIIRLESVSNWKENFFRKFPYKLVTKIFEGFIGNCDFYWLSKIKKYFKKNPPHDFDCVYAIYPPETSLYTGYWISRKFSIPFVVDFTDSLTYEPLRSLNRFQRWYRERAEKLLVSHALLTLCASANMAKFLKEKYPGKHFETVYMGYDEQDYVNLINVKKKSEHRKIRIAHFGNIGYSRERDSLPLWHALMELKSNGAIDPSCFELSFWCNNVKEESIMIKKLGLDNIVFFNEFVSKTEGLKIIIEKFDYLLLYGSPGQRSEVTSKLFDYLRLGKPILGICKGNEAEGIIRQTGSGEVCDFNKKEIAELFKKALKNQIHFMPDRKSIKTYERKSLAYLTFKLISNAVTG